MLVGAFEIKIGAVFLGPGGSMGFSTVKTWVEPESNQTSRMSRDLLVIVGIAARSQEARGGEVNQASAPSASKACLDALEHVGIVQHLAAFLVDEDRQRHAPGALARQHPVGPAFHHRADAVLRRAADTIWCRAIACHRQLAQRLAA